MTACIVGWAHTPFGKLNGESVESLIVKVAGEALSHAGVLPKDIDAAFRRWVRRQARFAERDAAQFQSKSPERRSTLEDALNALSREHANG